MVEICRYREEVAYTSPFKGTIQTKSGSKYVESELGKINGQEFILTKGGKSIWCITRRSKGEPFRFSFPISQMKDVQKVKLKVKGGEVRTYIEFTMTKGMHWTATFGKKDKNGKRLFKSKPSCRRCENYREKSFGSSGNQSGYNQSGRSI